MAAVDLCAYCGTAPGESRDHVIARGFFPESQRANLPQAPACNACNNAKSKLENYLVVMLPLGAAHPAAQDRIIAKFQRRMQVNPPLWREIMRGQNTVWVQTPSGLLVPTRSFTLRPEVAPTYFAMVGRGLLCHHTGTRLGVGYGAVAFVLPDQYFDQLKEVLNMAAAPIGQQTLASGAFSYTGFQAANQPQSSLWGVKLYDGITMRGGEANRQEGTMFVVITGRREFLRQHMAEFTEHMV